MTATPSDAYSPETTQDLPAPPRPVDARISRRAWFDPGVRSWWVLTLVLLLIGLFFIVSELRSWLHAGWLIKSGTLVDATAVVVDGESMRPGPDGLGRAKPPGSVLDLEFEWKGTKRTVSGVLEGRTEFLRVGQKVPIRVNPDDPNDWTGRTVNAPLAPHFAGGLVPIVLSLPVLLVSFLKRSSVLRTWRHGTPAEANVLGVSQTALAPRSRVVRCAPLGTGGQVQTVYVPASKLPEGAEVLPVLAPPKGGRLLAISWFV